MELDIPEKFIEKAVLNANSPEDLVLVGLGSRDGWEVSRPPWNCYHTRPPEQCTVKVLSQD